MRFILDIYRGSEVQPTPPETITCKSTREGIRKCRARALRIWERVERCYPSDDDVASYGPPDSDGYVTLRRPA